MDFGNIVVLAIVLIILGGAYNLGHKDGKRLGSRKGYGVGFSRGRRARHQNSGCLVLIIALGIILGTLATVLGQR